MKEVKLKNGSSEVTALVADCTLSLRRLADSGIPGITQLYDLREMCRDRSYGLKVSSTNWDALRQLSLVDGGRSNVQIHGSLRNIVLSSIDGEGMEMRLVDPVDRG